MPFYAEEGEGRRVLIGDRTVSDGLERTAHTERQKA